MIGKVRIDRPHHLKAFHDDLFKKDRRIPDEVSAVVEQRRSPAVEIYQAFKSICLFKFEIELGKFVDIIRKDSEKPGKNQLSFV